ncbi:MAG: DNA recombination/repair protein RecA, partial [Candidatus Cloacimonetes bacterium]|nr:DNA recombination/repair protein RecA [Candidatus Cloacimonadota bacterium]
GLQARLMSQALRKLTGIISKSNTAVIFINQIRMKIGVPAYMNPETTTGGVALKFYSSLRLEVRRSGAIKKIGVNAEIIGNKTKVKIVKNKFAPPFKNVEFPIIFGEGISHFEILIDKAVESDIIKKSGSWFSYEEVKIGQGIERVKSFLNENNEILSIIEELVKIELGLVKEPENDSKDDEKN